MNEKISYTCPRKLIFQTKHIFYTSPRNNFSSKTFLILVWKTNSLYLRKRIFFFSKVLHFRWVLNTALLFLILIKLKSVFDKLRDTLHIWFHPGVSFTSGLSFPLSLVKLIFLNTCWSVAKSCLYPNFTTCLQDRGETHPGG